MIKVEKLYFNGEFYSVDKEKNIYKAIGTKDGKIVFLSKGEDLDTVEANEKIDLQGRLVLPSFADTHLHAIDYAEQKQAVDLSGTVAVQEILERCREHYKEKGLRQGWLIGKGWNQNEFTDGNDFIYREDLDKISTEFPIVVVRTCVHVAVGNSKAMEIILKSEQAQSLLNYIDEEKGILREGAVALYKKLFPIPNIPFIKELILSAHEDLLKVGITQVHSADLFSAVPEEEWGLLIKAYQELEKEDKLKVRTYEQCMFFIYENFENFIDKGFRTGQGSAKFKIGPLKLITDGSLGARTAYMKVPYSDDNSTKGILILDEEKLRRFVKKAKENNMQLAIHTIGDGAADLALDILNEYNKEDLSNPMKDGLVHVQITDKDIFEKMKKGNVTAYIQPVFIDSDMAIAELRLGKERVSTSYAWKTMLDMGLLVTGGSDSPVVSFNVLENIYFAVTRKNIKGEPKNGWLPEQKLTVEEAVRLFTINPAYQSFEENEKGSLELGKFADMVVLEKNIFKISQDEIKNVKVDMTIVDGEIVFKR